MEFVSVYCLPQLPGSTLDEGMKDIFRCKFEVTKVNDLNSLLQAKLQERETTVCILEVRCASYPEQPKSPVEVAEEPEYFEQQFEMDSEKKQSSILDFDMETVVNVQADVEILQVDSQASRHGAGTADQMTK